MATNITVNFATAELIAQAQATQAANRAAQVEKERLAALEKAGKEAQANANLEDSAVLDDEAVRDAKLPPYGGYRVATAFRTSIFNLYIRCSDLVTFNVSQDIAFQDPAYQTSFGAPPNVFGAPGGNHYRKTRNLFDIFTLPLNKNTFVWCYFIREAFLEYTAEYNTPVTEGPGYLNTTTPGPSGQTTQGACMLVGPNHARDIPMPSLLYNRLVELNPPMIIDVVPSLVSESSLGNYGISGDNPDAVSYQPERSLYFDGGNNFCTPSIYDYILETNTSPTVAPRVTLKPCALDGTCVSDPELIYSAYGFDATSNPDDPVPVYRPFRPKVKLFTEVVPFSWVQDGTTFNAFTWGLNANVFGAWDWGKPSYCRSQLLALGFTEADLTPVTP